MPSVPLPPNATNRPSGEICGIVPDPILMFPRRELQLDERSGFGGCRSHRPQRDSDRHDESDRKSPPSGSRAAFARRPSSARWTVLHRGARGHQRSRAWRHRDRQADRADPSADNDEGVAVSISARRLVASSTSGSLRSTAASVSRHGPRRRTRACRSASRTGRSRTPRCRCACRPACPRACSGLM